MQHIKTIQVSTAMKIHNKEILVQTIKSCKVDALTQLWHKKTT